MWEPQPPATLRASTAYTGITLPFFLPFLFIYLFFSLPLSLVWLISCLTEASRDPVDFAEGESELMSGFNVEYGAGGFALTFLTEYANILFMRLLFRVIF
jgi:NADH-ubiquinone oxidoreductase chain 1